MDGNDAGDWVNGEVMALATEVVCPSSVKWRKQVFPGRKEGFLRISRCACGCAIVQDSAMFSIGMA